MKEIGLSGRSHSLLAGQVWEGGDERMGEESQKPEPQLLDSAAWQKVVNICCA